MTRLLALPGDSLVVFDAGARRVSVLTLTGAQGRLVTLTMAGPGSELASVLDNGWYVLGNTLPVPPVEGQFPSALQEIPRPQHLPAFASLIADHGGNLVGAGLSVARRSHERLKRL